MARTTFNRRPAGVNTPSSNDIKQNYFNHFNWKGINQNRNFLAVDQETFADANNIFVDDEGLLKSRLPFKFRYKFEGKRLKDVKVFGDIIICSYLNISNEWCIGIIEDEQWIVDMAIFADYPLKAFRNGNYVYIFTNTGVFSYDSDTKEFSQANMYEPIVRKYIGDNYEFYEDENLFSNYNRYQYILNPSVTTDISDGIAFNAYGKTGSYTHYVDGNKVVHEVEIDERQTFLKSIHQQLLDYSDTYINNFYNKKTSTILLKDNLLYRYNHLLNTLEIASTSDLIFKTIYTFYNEFEQPRYYVKMRVNASGFVSIIFVHHIYYYVGERLNHEDSVSEDKYIIDCCQFLKGWPDGWGGEYTGGPDISNTHRYVMLYHTDKAIEVSYYRRLDGNSCANLTQTLLTQSGDYSLESVFGDAFVYQQYHTELTPGSAYQDAYISLNLRYKRTNDNRPHAIVDVIRCPFQLKTSEDYMDAISCFIAPIYREDDRRIYPVTASYTLEKMLNYYSPRANCAIYENNATDYQFVLGVGEGASYETGIDVPISDGIYFGDYNDIINNYQTTGRPAYLNYSIDNGMYVSELNRDGLFYADFNTDKYIEITHRSGFFYLNTASGKWFYTLEDTGSVLSNYRIYSQAIDIRISKNTKYFSPDVLFKGDKIFLSKNNELVIGDIVVDDDLKEKLYFKKADTNIFDNKINGFQQISDNQVAIFTENDTWYNVLSDNLYHYSRSKIIPVLKNKSELITLSDSTTTLMPSYNGIVALSYQNFVNNSEQSTINLTQDLTSIYHLFSNNIRTINWKQYTLFYEQNNNLILIFDNRSQSWWRWTIPVKLSTLFVYNDLLYALANESIYEFTNEPDEYFDITENTEQKIDWYVQSQKMYLGANNYYKHIVNLTLASVQEGEQPISMSLSVKNYRKYVDNGKAENFDYRIDVIRTFVKRLNYAKVCEFQYYLSSDDTQAINVPLSLSNITVKYKIGGQVR